MKPPNLYVQRRMKQRDITEAEIDEALANPQTTYRSASDPDRLVVLSMLASGRRLKIVVLEADPEYVITVADRDREE